MIVIAIKINEFLNVQLSCRRLPVYMGCCIPPAICCCWAWYVLVGWNPFCKIIETIFHPQMNTIKYCRVFLHTSNTIVPGVLVASFLAVPFGADKQTTAGQQEFLYTKRTRTFLDFTSPIHQLWSTAIFQQITKYHKIALVSLIIRYLVFFKFCKAYFVEKLAAVESFVPADVMAELLAALLVVEDGVQ